MHETGRILTILLLALLLFLALASCQEKTPEDLLIDDGEQFFQETAESDDPSEGNELPEDAWDFSGTIASLQVGEFSYMPNQTSSAAKRTAVITARTVRLFFVQETSRDSSCTAEKSGTAGTRDRRIQRFIPDISDRTAKVRGSSIGLFIPNGRRMNIQCGPFIRSVSCIGGIIISFTAVRRSAIRNSETDRHLTAVA